MMWALEWLVQGMAVAAVATVVAQVLPSTAPRLRHGFWWLTLSAVLALPAMPALRAPQAVAATFDLPPRALAFEVAAPPSWFWAACVALWAMTALVGLAALLADLRALRVLKRSARPLPWPTPGTAHDARTPATLVRSARLLVADDLAGACAVGFFAPRVILSSRLASALEPAALDAIVRHELAHLARFDDWLRLLQRLVLSAAGLHPAVRWISRQIDIEREAACDHVVVEQVGDPVGYARALTAVAELTAGVRRSAPRLAPGALVGSAGLHARVVRLLLAERPSSPWRLWTTAVASVVTLVLAVTGVTALPPPVAIASLEPSLRALASLPAGRALLPLLPDVRGRLVPVSPLATTTLVVPETGERPASIATQPSNPLADVRAVEPTAPELVRDEALAVPARRELRIGPAVTAGSQPGLTDAIGARAARAGAATGSSAARAGTAVGRFFSKGGRAVTGRL